MSAHIACRPGLRAFDAAAGCFVVCPDHDLRQPFGFAHAVARAACREHNRIHHPEATRRGPRLMSVVYASQASPGFGASEVAAMLERARIRNRAFGVTGMLLFEHGWFLQALEGPEPIVDDLMRSIRGDLRHGHVHVLAREARQDRRFPDWAMAEGHVGQVEALPLSEYFEALLIARGEAAEEAAAP